MPLTPSERYFYKELKKRIKKGETEIYLKDLTNFDWDEMLLKNINYEPGGTIPKNKYLVNLSDKERNMLNDGNVRCWVFIKKNIIINVMKRKSMSIKKINFHYSLSNLNKFHFNNYVKIKINPEVKFDEYFNLKYKEMILKEDL